MAFSIVAWSFWHGPGQLRDQRPLVVDLLLRQEVLPADRLVAIEVALGAVELRLVAGQRRLPLVQQDLERARIDLGQDSLCLTGCPSRKTTLSSRPSTCARTLTVL